MNTTIPVSTLLFAVLLGRERVRARKLAALATALVGVLLVIRPWAAEVPARIQVGDLLTLVNATSFSFFLVISKRLMEKVDALAATALLLAVGSLGIAPLGLPQLLTVDPAGLSTQFWWLAAFIIVFPTAAAYLINYWALGRVDSSLVAFFIYLQPALAAGLSWLVLGERLTAPVIVGAALIFGAVGLAIRR
jgi:drug/metabolite transporter (DMT)-like permease